MLRGNDHVGHAATHCVLTSPAENHFGLFVPSSGHTVRIHGNDSVQSFIQHQPGSLLVLQYLFFGALLPTQIQHKSDALISISFEERTADEYGHAAAVLT